MGKRAENMQKKVLFVNLKIFGKFGKNYMKMLKKKGLENKKNRNWKFWKGASSLGICFPKFWKKLKLKNIVCKKKNRIENFAKKI